MGRNAERWEELRQERNEWEEDEVAQQEYAEYLKQQSQEKDNEMVR